MRVIQPDNMGGFGSKPKNKEPKNFFENQRYERDRLEKERAEMKKAKKPRTNNKIEETKIDRSVPVLVPKLPSSSYDDEMLRMLRFQIKNDPNSFLLNNIMLAVQFFDNYERVNNELKNYSTASFDGELNTKMAPHQKHVVLPDKLWEQVNDFVQYVSKYTIEEQVKENVPRRAISVGKTKAKNAEPLWIQRLFIIHDNIEANKPEEDSDYSMLGGVPFYTMIKERADEPGYMMLRLGKAPDGAVDDSKGIRAVTFVKHSDSEKSDDEDDDVNDVQSSSSTSDVDDVESGYELLERLRKNQERKRITVLKPTMGSTPTQSEGRRLSGIIKQPSAAVQKGQIKMTAKQRRLKHNNENQRSKSIQSAKSYDSDYGYATITAETTPKRLEKSKTGRVTDSTSNIPDTCFSIVEVRQEESEIKEYMHDGTYVLRTDNFHREIYRKIKYFNSERFLVHFNDLFLLKLAGGLGFNEESLSQALTQGASIYCTMNKNGKNKSFEIIPAVQSVWPSNVTDWLTRPRTIIKHPRTNKIYQWPNQQILNISKGIGCVLIPLGFRPTRGVNQSKELEWKVAFPLVEKYLETSFHHAHVRSFLFTMVLFKTFMEIQSSYIGMNSQHIRNHLYRQIEENFIRWPEERLGEAMMGFLKLLYQQMSRGSMQDFFLPQCNLFKGIPKHILNFQQRRLADIIEYPVMHLLASLKNIHYVKKNYYPVLDYKKLYKILTQDDVLRLVNPNLPSMEDSVEEDNPYKRDATIWNEIRSKNAPQEPKQRPRVQNGIIKEMVIKNVVPKSHIDRKHKVKEFNTHRRRLVLRLFIPHFIMMSDQSQKFSAYRQSMMYLEHSKRLACLLRDEAGGIGEAQDFLDIIDTKIIKLKTSVTNPGGPRVPKRNETIYMPSGSGTNTRHNYDEEPVWRFHGNLGKDVRAETVQQKNQRIVSFQNGEDDDETNESSDFVEESKL